jgi:(p)ppGpp synthase/HD superfamily hydrolase
MMLSSRFDQALAFAADAHAGQVRKGSSVPYIAHPLAVASLALEHGADEDEAIAAVLHDTVEDCGGEPVRLRIERAFGERVAEIVAGCSEAAKSLPWEERKRASIAKYAHASRSVVLVSACDKLHNARAIQADRRRHGEAVWDRFNAGRDRDEKRRNTLWYYREVVTALKAVVTGDAGKRIAPLVEELDLVVQSWSEAAGSGTEPKR